MKTKDKFIIAGVIVIILLNLLVLSFIVGERHAGPDTEITSAAILMRGELAQGSGLQMCCDVPSSDEDCYVLEGSSCNACLNECQ